MDECGSLVASIDGDTKQVSPHGENTDNKVAIANIWQEINKVSVHKVIFLTCTNNCKFGC